jgi:hypothetical protein
LTCVASVGGRMVVGRDGDGGAWVWRKLIIVVDEGGGRRQAANHIRVGEECG